MYFDQMCLEIVEKLNRIRPEMPVGLKYTEPTTMRIFFHDDAPCEIEIEEVGERLTWLM